jgi:curved DNA-binding protein CbpA
MSVQAADPYVVLELRRDANEEQIQRAYRKLSMRWHPDRNQGSAKAAERFSNINEAYDVLTTRSLRALLDKQGLVALGRFLVQTIRFLLSKKKRKKVLPLQALDHHHK